MLFELFFDVIDSFSAQQQEANHEASTPFSMGGLDLSQDAINPCNDFGSTPADFGGFGGFGGFDSFGF